MLVRATLVRATLFALLLPLSGCESGSGVTLVTILPANPTSADALSAQLLDASGQPADLGDYVIAWRVDGVASDQTTATVPATATARGEVWEVGLVAGSATIASSPVTIANAVPSISEVQLSPSAPRSDEPIEALIGGWVDADADPPDYRFEWTVNGLATGGDSATLPAGSAARDDVVALTVTPRDAFSEGAPVTSAAVTVTNGLPFAPLVTIGPQDPAIGVDDLVCAVDETVALDPDGDACSFVLSWQLDGLPFPDPATPGPEPTTTVLTGDTVPAAQTQAGQTWTCRAVANDGIADGPPGEDSVLLTTGPMSDFALVDVNATSPTTGTAVSPRDYLEKVSGWYFGHAT
jgi:hypothetical protein